MSKRAALLAGIRAKSEPELLAALPLLKRPTLEVIEDDQGLEDCGCRPLAMACDCGCVHFRRVLIARPDGDRLENHPCACPDCGDDVDWEPCPHVTTRGNYLPWRALLLLGELLRADPPPPPSESPALKRTARVTVLAKRHRAGVGLWHEKDAVHEDPDSPVNARMRRMVYTLDGWRRNGCPQEVCAPPKNGDEVVGQPNVWSVRKARARAELEKNCLAALKRCA